MDKKLFPGTQFISTILEVLDAKSEMSSQVWRVYLMRAAMAGMIIGIFYVAYYTILAGFDSNTGAVLFVPDLEYELVHRLWLAALELDRERLRVAVDERAVEDRHGSIDDLAMGDGRVNE